MAFKSMMFLMYNLNKWNNIQKRDINVKPNQTKIS